MDRLPAELYWKIERKGTDHRDKEDWRKAAPNTSGCGQGRNNSWGHQAHSREAIMSHGGGEYLLAGENIPIGLLN